MNFSNLGQVKFEFVERSNFDDSFNCLIGFSKPENGFEEFVAREDFCHLLDYQLGESILPVGVFEIIDNELHVPAIYFFFKGEEFYHQIYGSDSCEVLTLTTFAGLVADRFAKGAHRDEVMLELATWRIAQTSLYANGVEEHHFCLLFACNAIINESTDAARASGYNDGSVIQVWCSRRTKQIAICSVQLGQKFHAGWRVFDLGSYVFNALSVDDGYVSVELKSLISGKECSILMTASDSLSLIELLSSPESVLARCTDFYGDWIISSKLTTFQQKLLKLSAVQSQISVLKDQMFMHGDPASISDQFREEVLTACENFTQWDPMELGDPSAWPTVPHPASVPTVSTWISEINEDIRAMGEHIDALVASNQTHLDETMIDPFAADFWHQCSDRLVVRPKIANDPVVQALKELPFINQRVGGLESQLIDWSNSSSMPIDPKSRSSLFDLAEKFLRLTLEAVAELEVDDSGRVLVTGYAPAGLFVAKRNLQFVQLMTRMSRHLRKSTYMYALLVETSNRVGLVFVSGEFYREMRNEFARSMAEQQRIRNYADYQAQAIRRELDR